MKSITQIWRRTVQLTLAVAFGLAASAAPTSTSTYTNALTFSQSGLSSTNGSSLIYLPSNPYAAGDLIYFNGTTAANNPFGTSALRYFVIYSSGNNIRVATTFNGVAANAVNNITGGGIAQQHPNWLKGSNWIGGSAPNGSGAAASFPNAGGGVNPPGGLVINSNVTIYGLGWNNASQDLAIYSGSSNSVSLYPLTLATADGTTPKITCTNAFGGVIFLGHSSQGSALKISGTQGLIFNAGAGGAITGSGTAATSSGPAKDIRVYNTVNWADFSGGLQIERGQISQQNGASTLPTTQNLTVGNSQTVVNNLLAALSLNARDCTIGALNGVSLGRIYCGSSQSVFSVGNNNSNGIYAGSIGYNFDGTIPAGNVWLHKVGNGTQTIAGPIAGTNTTVTVDAGTLTLSGINIYKGLTTVTAGKLIVSSAQLTTNSITVANGASLGVTVSGASQLTPFGLTNAASASTLEFINLASLTTAPIKPTVMAVNGSVTINITGGSLVPGNSYPLINWTTINGAGGFVLGTCAYIGSLTTNGNTLVLNITAATNTWTGATDGNWDTTTANWSPANYSDGSLALFDDTATGVTNVTINQLVKPGSAVFNHSSLNYSVTATSANYLGGAGNLVKSGSGTLTLDGPNAYSGGTSLSAGQLNLNYGGSNATNSALGSGPLTISGGVLDNTSASDVTWLPALTQNWNGNFAYLGSAHNLHLGNGSVTLAASCTVAITNHTLTIGGTIGDSSAGYALTKTGNGTLELGGANTFSGGLNLSAGTVKAGHATALGTGGSQLGVGVLDLNGSTLANSNNINDSAFMLTNSSAAAAGLAANTKVNANFTIGVGPGSISVARLIDTGAPLVVTKIGAGTLTFNGAGHNNLMGVTVNAGTAIFANTGGFTVDRGVTNNGGTIILSGTGSGGAAPNANLIGDNNSFVMDGGTFDLNGWNETVGTVNGLGGIILNNATGTTRTLTVGGDDSSATFAGAFQNGTGGLALGKTGAGTQTLTGSNTYTGSTTISAGTWQAGAANAFSPNSDVTVTGTLDLNAFDNRLGGLSGAGTVDTASGGTPTLTVGYNGGSGNFSGTLQNSGGTLSLAKVGAGTQILSGANNFSGATSISNGTLVAASAFSGAGAVLVYGPGVLSVSNSLAIAGAVALSGTNATLALLDGQITTLTLSGNLTLTSSNVLKLDVSVGGADQINVGGTFAQSGKTVVNINQVSAPNAGTYTLLTAASGLNAANFVLGNSLSGYALSLTSDGANLYLTVALNAPATAYWNNHFNTVWSGHTGATYNWDTDQTSGLNANTVPAASSDVFFAANGASSFSTSLGADFILKSLTFNVASSVTITGAANSLTLNGALTVNSGAGNPTISASNVVLGVDQTITVADAGNTLTISSSISGAHALAVSGSGQVALAGVSTYTGNTTINGGTLALKNPTNTLPDATAINVNGGTLSLGTNNDTVGAVTLISGNITGGSGVLKGSAYEVQNGTVSANLGGSAALTMTGGSVLLASNSTYSGGTLISSGALQLGASNALGGASVTLANATTLDLNGQTIPNVINFSSAGTLRNDSAAAAAVTGDANVTSNPTIDTTGGDLTVARLIGTGVARTVTKTGGNTLTFNGAGHNNLVKLVVQGGTVVCANTGGFSADRGFELDFGTVKLAGSGSGGASPNANLFNDGQQFWLLGTPGTFDLNGWNETVATVYGIAGTVIQNSAVGTNSTLTVGGDNGAANNTFSGTLQDGGGILSIAKTGSGVQILNGTATYSGSTTINNGQLQVTASGTSPGSTFVINTNGGLTFDSDTTFLLGGLSGAGNVELLNLGSSPIALTVGANQATTTYSGALLDGGAGATVIKVGTGTLTLAGTNAYAGLTTASNGVLLISANYVAGGNFTVNEGASFGVTGNLPTTSAQVGTLTAGLTGASSSTLLFPSLPVPTNAPLTVSTFSPVGGAGSVLIANTATLNVGTYNLINYTTFTGAGFSALALAPLPPGTTAYLVNNTAASPKVIQLVVTAVAPQIWSGAVNTNWDLASTLNWKLNSVATNYHNASPVLFDDSVGSGQTTVNLTTNLLPSNVTVSNLTKNFTFTTVNGSGINAYDSFTKAGSGTLTLVNLTNSFVGSVAIQAGTVVLAASTLGSGDITNNGTLVYSNGTPLLSLAISGTGTLVQHGTNILEISGTNTHSGGTLIRSGTLQSDHDLALGSGPVTLGDGASANSATLQASPSANFGNANAIVIAAGGTGVNRIQNLNNRDYTLSGPIALNNALTLAATGDGALFLTGSLTSGGANPTVTIDGGGTTTKFVGLNASNAATFTGNFIVTNRGNLKLGAANALSAINSVALDSTGAFDNGSLNQRLAGLNDYGASGGTVAVADVFNTGVALTLGGSGNYAFSGVINNNGALVKTGSGQQTLAGANTYTGATVVSNGTLIVSGSLAGGAVTVAGGTLAGSGLLKGATTVTGGTLAPGLGGLGTLAISNSLTLQAGGTLAMDLNKTAATQDQIVGLTTVNYGGTLAVNNLAGSLTTTDSFKLFSATTYTGAFASLTPATPGTGLVWNTNTLTVDGTLRIATSMATNPTNITATVSGNLLILTWPADHTGWYLQAQTNTLGVGLGTNWITISNTVSGNSYTNVMNPANGAVFYRLLN